MQSLHRVRCLACVVVSLFSAPQLSGQATGTWTGRIVNDRTSQPLGGVEVSIPTIALSVTSDSTGRFTLDNLAAGEHQAVARRIGYQPMSILIDVPDVDGGEHLLRLVPSLTELAKVDVVTTAIDRRLTLFESHRKSGYGGSFLTADQIMKDRGRPMGDVLQTVVGSDIVRGRSGAAYFATRRGYDSFMNMPKARPADRARGASSGLCYAAVVLNNVFVYRGDDEEDMFDVNSLAPDDIIAVEVYKGGATMPLEYNATRKTCGLLVIYTK